jgi:hypothetical protein
MVLNQRLSQALRHRVTVSVTAPSPGWIGGQKLFRFYGKRRISAVLRKQQRKTTTKGFGP